MIYTCNKCGKPYKLIISLTDVEVKELCYINSKVFAIDKILNQIENLEYSKNIALSIKLLYNYKKYFSIQKMKFIKKLKNKYNVNDTFYIFDGGLYIHGE